VGEFEARRGRRDRSADAAEKLWTGARIGQAAERGEAPGERRGAGPETEETSYVRGKIR
jgi:hypothetical protein